MREMRWYQSKAIDLCREALRAGKKRVMLALPTASGKTVISAEIVRLSREKGRRVLFVVDAKSLIAQTVKAFKNHGLTGIGVIQAQHELTDPSQPIQVASVQTLAKRQTPSFDLAIIDEAHRLWATVKRLMEEHPDVPFIGLSATPWTKGLGHLYHELLTPVSMAELIKQGHLVGYEIFAPSHPDLSSAKVVAGDYAEDDLSRIMGDERLIADIVETWKGLARGRPTLCFCVDRKHARMMQDRFIAAGVPCGYIDGETPVSDREEIEAMLNRGEISIVANVGCLTTGVDWSVGCIILARPTKSSTLAVQMIGRGLRVNAGPAAGNCIVLDHTDTILRLGMPADIGRTDLCTAQKGERQSTQGERPVREPVACPKCHKVRRMGGKCTCGWEPRQADSGLLEGVGQLARLDGKAQGPKKQPPTPAEKRSFYQQLLSVAGTRGKKPGWALANFRDRYGEWPNGKNSARPETPSEETLLWLRAKAIRYAKGRESAARREEMREAMRLP